MKTFNSTLAIAAIALTSVFGFTSCDKDNEAFNNAPAANKGNQTVYTAPQGQQTQAQQNQGQPSANEADSVQEKTFKSNMADTKDYNFIGTWEYTSPEGKTYVLNVTNKIEKDSLLPYYAATLTIDGVEYEGEMNSGNFKTIAKSTDTRSRLCVLLFATNASKSTDTELVANIVYDRQKAGDGVAFKKVNAATNEARRGPHFPPY